MEHQHLVEAIAEETRYTKREVRRFLVTLYRIVWDELIEGGDVVIKGLGTFENFQRGPWNARSKYTGERIFVPARRFVRFVASHRFKKAVKIKSSRLFEIEDPRVKYSLGRLQDLDDDHDIEKEVNHGEVRSGHRPGESGEREERRSRQKTVWKSASERSPRS